MLHFGPCLYLIIYSATYTLMWGQACDKQQVHFLSFVYLINK